MKNFLLGQLHGTNRPFYIPRSSFDTHWHLLGGTGKGKTTALHAILHPLMMDPLQEPCIVIIDRLGGLSFDLLLWMASDFCTEEVRKRLIYVEPARENVVLGFNPLLFDTPAHAFYKVARASEIILRGWASQNLDEMPRLARWLFNSFIAGAMLGLTIADTEHLLLPGSPHHRQLLECLPPRLKHEWAELIGNRSGESARILESARNRLKPYYESTVLRNMFGATHNRLDMLRFMREGKILLLNLAPGNRLPEQVADAIGGLVINEILTTARSQPAGLRYPTYLFLDEFQRFVGPDLEIAIPEVRQVKIKLILSHQSLSQLRRGDHDLSKMIFQCQSRMIFGLQGEDADLLAHELASINFDPYKIKNEIYSHRQRIAGYTTELLHSWTSGNSELENWMRQVGENSGTSRTTHRGRFLPAYADAESRSQTNQRGMGGGRATSSSATTHEQRAPIHEDFMELVNRTFTTFEEDKQVWARKIRTASRGRAFVRLVDQPQLFDVDVKRSAAGYLAWDAERLAADMPEALDEMERLIEENFKQEWFVTPDVIERETMERLQRALQLGKLSLRSPSLPPPNHPFA